MTEGGVAITDNSRIAATAVFAIAAGKTVPDRKKDKDK
jgi:hypothetical protein